MADKIKYENMKFEELMDKLESTVKELENGNFDLDSSINKYSDAMKMVKACNDKLNNATETVNKILKDGQLEDFNIDE